MPLIQRYFSWVILGVVALAFVWPEPGSIFKPYLTPILMAMMVLSCLKIDFKELKQIPSNLWRYLLVLGFIFIIPTGIVFLFKPVLESEIFAGLILVTAVPSAVSVVFMSDLLGGEPTKALVATTLAHLVSPFLRALIAADVIFWGVGKSGWPISKWIIFFPSVSSLVALFKTA